MTSGAELRAALEHLLAADEVALLRACEPLRPLVVMVRAMVSGLGALLADEALMERAAALVPPEWAEALLALDAAVRLSPCCGEDYMAADGRHGPDCPNRSC